MYDTAAILLSAGLDPDRCIFFRQSDVAEHTELCWLLSSVTSFGELNRMTQFKEKSGAQRELVSSGLFIIRCFRRPTCSPIAPTKCQSGMTSASTSN